MKIIIAPDSFKESMSAELAAQSVIKGFKRVFPDAEYISLPVADGGEGTVDALVAAQQGKKISATVSDPLGFPVMAYYGLLAESKTAVIEMAQASGLMLVPIAKRNPMLTNSYGTGELIANALTQGVERIILGIMAAPPWMAVSVCYRRWVSGFMIKTTNCWGIRVISFCR